MSLGSSEPDVVTRFPLGSWASGCVVRQVHFGLFLDLGSGTVGFVDAAGMAEAWENIPERHTWPGTGEIVTGVVVRVEADQAVQVRLTLQPSVLEGAAGVSEPNRPSPEDANGPGPNPFPT